MDGSPPPDDPERIGPYRILQVLGAGGMGIVYEAEQLVPVRRRVALKVIKLGMDTKEVVARFEAERQALAVMSHPGIAQVLDAGVTEEGRPYFVMELVKGIPLTEYCDNEQLRLRDRIALFIQVANAVQHAHQKGVIHRDLKPSNILVTEHEGRPVTKVIDFGIAKAIAQPLTDKTLVTAYGLALGTLAYMSPEQAEYSNLDIDTRSDIYSLGVMLFEMLVGELPVDPGTMGALPFLAQLVGRVSEPALPSSRMTTTARARRQAELRGADSEQLRRMLRGDLDWIVVKAMEKDRNRRYDTANALALDLERYLRNEPVLARPPTAWYRFRKFAARHRAAVAAAAGIALALVGGAVLATVGLVRATAAEEVARRESATAQQVSAFLVDLFRVGDPGRTGGRQVTVKEILDSGAVRIRRELGDQPLVQARLQATIGDAYYGLRELEPARVLLEEARATQATAGAPAEELAGTTLLLANVLIQQREFALADQLNRELLASFAGDSASPPSPLEVGATTTLVFSGLRQGNPPADGEAMLRGLLARRDSAAPDDPEMANVLDMLCWVLLDKGDLAAAEGPCTETVSLRRQFADLDQMGLLVGLHRLGVLRHRQGRVDEAIIHLRESVLQGERLYGPTNFENAYNHLTLSAVFRQLGDLDSALVHATAAARVRRTLLADDDLELAGALFELAVVQRQRGDRAAGLATWREGLAVSDRARAAAWGDPLAGVLAAMQQRGMHAALLREVGQPAAAQAEDDRVIALLDSARTEGLLDSTAAALALNRACWLASLAGHGARALPTCDAAVAASDESARPRIRDSRGVARAQAGDLAGAIADFEAYIARPANTAGVPIRVAWVAALRQGENPFSRPVLDRMILP